MLVVTGDVSSPSCASAIHVQGLMHRLKHFWVTAHSEVVIGTPDSDSFIFGGHMSPGEFLGEAIDVVEIAVGFILVLLIQLVVVEAFVVEIGDRRSGWFGTWCECNFGLWNEALGLSRDYCMLR